MPGFFPSRPSPRRSRGASRRPDESRGRWRNVRGWRIWPGREAPGFGADYPFSVFRAGCASVAGRAFSFLAACLLGVMAAHATTGGGLLMPWDALGNLPLLLFLMCGVSTWNVLMLLGLLLLFIFHLKCDLPWPVLLVPLVLLWWRLHVLSVG